MVNEWQRALRIATADEPADLILRGGQVVNVFTGEIEQANITIADGRIVGIGDYENAAEVIDLDGAFVAPSFIDGHFHTESSLLWITQFARAVVPHGTGAIVTDPHEIVNVAGLTGFNALAASSDVLEPKSPLRVGHRAAVLHQEVHTASRDRSASAIVHHQSGDDCAARRLALRSAALLSTYAWGGRKEGHQSNDHTEFQDSSHATCRCQRELDSATVVDLLICGAREADSLGRIQCQLT